MKINRGEFSLSIRLARQIREYKTSQPVHLKVNIPFILNITQDPGNYHDAYKLQERFKQHAWPIG